MNRLFIRFIPIVAVYWGKTIGVYFVLFCIILYICCVKYTNSMVKDIISLVRPQQWLKMYLFFFRYFLAGS